MQFLSGKNGSATAVATELIIVASVSLRHRLFGARWPWLSGLSRVRLSCQSCQLLALSMPALPVQAHAVSTVGERLRTSINRAISRAVMMPIARPALTTRMRSPVIGVSRRTTVAIGSSALAVGT